MSPIEILKKAQEGNYAVGQFNVSTLEQMKAAIGAAQATGAAIIIGTSEGEAGYLGIKQAVALVKSFREEAGLNLILNLDHGSSFESVKTAIDAGYDAVHFDGSKMPLADNIRETKKVVEYAKSKSPEILVEGEVGAIIGSSVPHEGKIEIRPEDLTSPEEVRQFVAETGVDSLAAAIGNVHGVYAEMPKLDIGRLKEIQAVIGGKFLVLHGASGINEADIKAAIGAGIVKINVNTEIRMAYRQGLGKTLADNPQEVKPYKLMPLVVAHMEELIKSKINLFGNKY